MLPQASVDPAARRATRAWLRRRRPRLRRRAALRAPIHKTKSPDNLPELGHKLADHTHRTRVAERCPEPAVPKSVAVDRARLGHDAHLLRDVELAVLNTAQWPDAHTLERLRTLPGIGELLSLGLRDERHHLQRFPRGQECASSGRLVTCAQASAGKRDGTSGTTIGQASLTWAFAAAAVLLWRTNPAGQQDLARWEKKPGKGQALTVLAHHFARAVYDRCNRGVVVELDTFLQGSGAAQVSLRPHGVTLGAAWRPCSGTMSSWRRRTPLSPEARCPDPARLSGRIRSLL
jgi:hypothetical protein